MRLLIDNNLSPRLSSLLTTYGHQCVHARDVNLTTASDADVCFFAVTNRYVLITADNDFPQILALSGADKPSVVLLTGTYPSEPEALAIFLGNQLPKLEADLERGAVAALGPVRTRIRNLPI